jgi:hypothetical protein
MESPYSPWLAFVLLTVCTYVAGSAATLLPRMLLAADCSMCGFASLHAPVFVTLIIFVSNSFSIVYQLRVRRVGAPESTRPAAPALTGIQRYMMLAIPGSLNLIACLAQIVALMYISASLLAGMRGFLIIFVTFISRACHLRDTVHGWKAWLYVMLYFVGTAMICLSSGLETLLYPDAVSQVASAEAFTIGVVLSIAAYAVAGLQFGAEQWLIENLSFPPFTVMAGGNAWAGFMCILIFVGVTTSASGSIGGLQLDRIDDIHCCLTENPRSLGLAFGYGVSSLTFNLLLYTLCSRFGAIYRASAFTCRGILTAAFELVAFAVSHSTFYGSEATPLSAGSIAGFLVLISASTSQLLSSEAFSKPRVTAACVNNADEAGLFKPLLKVEYTPKPTSPHEPTSAT